MAGERNDDRADTAKASTSSPGPLAEVQVQVELHRKIAARLLGENAAPRAFAELVLASRELPMTSRLAATLVYVARKAGTEPAAVKLLAAGVEEAEGDERLGVQRQLVRLLRRKGDLEGAREALVVALAERPRDRRARVVLNALLAQEGRWEELDASLEREVGEASRRGAFRRAARGSLERARLWGDRLGHPGRAALRYGQAAQYSEQAADLETAFSLRLLWLQALRRAKSPERALSEAIEVCKALGEKVGKGQRARAVAGDPAAAADQTRRSTQRELVAAADEAEAKGNRPEAAALLAAALKEGPDAAAAQKLEANYVARREWRELARLYRERAAAAADATLRTEALGRLAELLEDELHDPAAAAQVYGELVRATGDRRALAEQVRLLSSEEDGQGVTRALDDAVEKAAGTPARADALVARGESAVSRGDAEAAKTDFEAALREVPDHLAARAGLADATGGARASVLALRDALAASPRRSPGRGELFRRLARLAEPLGDEDLVRHAWSEALFELPADGEAQQKVRDFARKGGDSLLLLQLLSTQIEREPRGPAARAARLERVGLLERAEKMDEALEELREAVRYEPAHREAWAALADRLAARGKGAEVAWALEQAASATEDLVERQRLWERLVRIARVVLKDDARAAAYAARAEALRQSRAPPTVIPPTPVAAATAEIDTDPGAESDAGGRGATEEVELPPGEATVDASDEDWEGSTVGPRLEDGGGENAGAQALPADEQETVSPDEDVLEVTTGDVEMVASAVGDWIAPPGELETSHHTEEIRVDPADAEAGPSGSVLAPLPPQRLTEERELLFQRVRDNPLASEGYLALAEYFDNANDATRCSLMLEIANALEGDPNAAPRPPRLICSATDRAGLRHPSLRGEAGELLGIAGLALCRLHPARGRAAGSKEPFRPDAGRGGQGAAEALLMGVRILGLRAPDVLVSEDNGPPFSLVFAGSLRLLVGRLAVKKQIPEAELRFFAGRSLFTQNPDLLALRSLSREQLSRSLAVLGAVLRGGKGLTSEGRALRDGLPRQATARLRALYDGCRKTMDLSALAAGARHSANRAGLVVCGGIAPALAALKAKKALETEVVELVRFAASERYLLLRSRRLGAG